jgi:AraC-like DNA-binding protein
MTGAAASYREQPLSPPLDRFVECVWTRSAPATPPTPERIAPDGCVEVIVQLASVARAARPDGPFALQPAAFLLAPLGGPLALEPTGAMETFGIRFRPGGAAAFLRFPVDTLGPGETPLDAAFGREGAELVERIAEAATFGQRIAACETFLTGRLAVAGFEGSPVGAIVRRMLRETPRLSVAAAAGECGWSVRQLERRFRRETGLTPRLFGRIVRFQRVFRAVGADSGPDWVSVALECGYADQPHLIREFRELAGETPAAFLKPDSGVARVFVAPERLARFFAG